MSDVQQGPGWWLASDGKWYPPETAPRQMPPPPVAAPPGGSGPLPVHPAPAAVGTTPSGGPPPGPAHTVSTGLGGTIQGFSWAVAGLSAIAALLAVVSLVVFNEYWDTPINSRAEARAYDDWVAVDESFSGIAGVAFLCGLVLWILLMIWMNSAHKTTQRLWSGDRHWTSGWAVGSWFIPVANAVLPRLVMAEIERIALAPRRDGVVADDSWKQRATLPVGTAWWISLVAGTVLTLIGNAVGTEYDSSADEVRVGYVLDAIGLSLVAASGVLGALYVRRLGRRLSAAGLLEQP